MSALLALPFKDKMTPDEFAEAVIECRQANPAGDMNAAPFLYSIEVASPSGFFLEPARFKGTKDIKRTTIPEGFLDHDEIYGFKEKKLIGILQAYAWNANSIKIKAFEEADGRLGSTTVQLQIP